MSSGQKSIFIVVTLLALAGCGATAPRRAQAQGGGAAPTVMVPMPDGVALATDVYLPFGAGPWPVLLIRTPYGRANAREFDPAPGFALVAQDMRGYGDSQGVPSGFLSERQDGQATLAWVLAQPWSNGRVATFGGSAPGASRYWAIPGAPPALRCQWVEAASADLYVNGVFQGGVYRQELEGLRLSEEENDAGLAKWADLHPLNDGAWAPVQVTDFGQVHAAGVHVSGWYDIFARGTINAFLGYQYRGGWGAAGRQRLIMGPWTHDINSSQTGELAFPNAFMEGLDGWLRLWLYACLLGRNDLSDLALMPTVQYFTMGAADEVGAPGNEWRTAPSWPPPGARLMPLYLLPGGGLALEPPWMGAGGDSFTYDPANPVPTLGGANLHIEAGAYDQRPIEQRGDVLVYSTPALGAPLEVTGDLSAVIWLTTDVPDTDIVLRLTDVYPDGRSMLLADGVAQARYRYSPDFSFYTLLAPDIPYRLTLDLGPTSIIFNAGHRLRVSVTSSNAPRFTPNTTTGALYPFADATARPAHTTIWHDAARPSALLLPLVLR